MAWRKEQAKEFIKKAKQEWGCGWEHLSETQKCNALAKEVLFVLLLQDNATVKVEDIDELWNMVKQG